jgi:hypothetical protein
MLVDTFEQAEQTGDDGRLAIQLRRLFQATEDDGGGYLQYLDDDLDEIEEWNLSDLCSTLEDWHTNRDFARAQTALDLLDELIDDADDRDWYQAAAQLHHRRIKLKAGLSGHNAEDELTDTLDFLENHGDEVLSSNQIQPIVELVEQNTDSISDDGLLRWMDLCDDIIVEKRANNRHQQEREFIGLKMKLKQELGQSTEPEQERIIESVEAEAEHQGKRSNLLKATVLERGLDRCAEFLPDDKKEEWKREAVESRRRGAEEEMVEMSPGEELVKAEAEEVRKNAGRLVGWFESVKETYESSTYALYCLLCSDGYVPNWEMAKNTEKGFVFREAFGTQYTSPEGHAIGVNPPAREEKERIPSSYPRNIDNKNRTLADGLYRLIDSGSLTEFDFHVLLDIANVTPHTHAFLTDAVLDLFDSNYVQSLAVAMPHLEGAIVDTLDHIGRSATAKTEDGTQQQAFGGLLEDLEDDIESEYLQYLKVNYTDGRGPNQRNRWSHGQFRYFQANFRTAVITIFDTLKTLIQLNPSPFVAVFSLPSETISTRSRRQQGIDLSAYLKEGQKILAYGYEDDTAIIVAENEEEDRTPFLVIRGTIAQDYGLPETGLSRDEIRDNVELLKDPTPDVPDDIELTWLDIEDAVQDQVSRIITDLDDGDGALQEDVVEIAKRFGLRGDRVKSAIDSLVEDGNITMSDDKLIASSESTPGDE